MLADPHPRVRWGVGRGLQAHIWPPGMVLAHAGVLLVHVGSRDEGVGRAAGECLRVLVTQVGFSSVAVFFWVSDFFRVSDFLGSRIF